MTVLDFEAERGLQPSADTWLQNDRWCQVVQELDAATAFAVDFDMLKVFA